jgi:tetratricopeptide (TPR) repeat protein
MEQVVALIRPSGLRRLLAAGLNSLGIHLKCLGEYQEARAHFEEALALARELGNKVLVAAIQGSLGDVWLRQGELDLAASAYQEGISLATEIGWVYSLAANILGIAGVATAIGQEHEAARLLGATEVVLNITGESFGEPERIDHEYIMQTLSVRLDGQALEAARAEGRTLSKDQAVALALEIAEAAQGK